MKPEEVGERLVALLADGVPLRGDHVDMSRAAWSP